MYDRHVEFTTQVSSCVKPYQQDCIPCPVAAGDWPLSHWYTKASGNRSCYCKTYTDILLKHTADRTRRPGRHQQSDHKTIAMCVQNDSSGNTKPARTIEYDIVGAPQADFSFAVTFPFHPSPAGGYVTIIREYSQGANDLLFNLPTGTSINKNYL